MNRQDMINACVSVMEQYNQCDSEYEVAVFALYHLLSSASSDVLKQLVEDGPVGDGEICSKMGRDELLDLGLISKAIVKGKDGYQVANYKGFAVYRAQSKLQGKAR